MNKNTMKVIEHIKAHTGNSNIQYESDAADALIRIFKSKDIENVSIQQCPLCQNFLAVCLWRGVGCLADYSKSYELLFEAAKSGLVKSQTNLAIFIQEEKLVPKDLAAALYWLNKASEQDDSTAQEKLNSGSFPTILKDQSHGNHMEAAFSKPIMDVVKYTIANGDNIKAIETFVFEEDGLPIKRKVFSLEHTDGDVTALGLLVSKEKSNELLSMFPVSSEGNVVEIEIEKVYVWENGIEATIQGYIDDKPISFFMTNYYLHKEKVYPKSICEFKISAFAYNCECVTKKTFQFEGEQAISFLEKINNSPDYDENGNIKPVVFNLENMVAFLQSNEKYLDEMEYQSPIVSVQEIEAWGDQMYKIQIHAFRNPDIDIPIYLKKDLLNVTPILNMPIRGNGWVQGIYIE